MLQLNNLTGKGTNPERPLDGGAADDVALDGAAVALDFERLAALSVLALEAVRPGLVVGRRLAEARGGGCRHVLLRRPRRAAPDRRTRTPYNTRELVSFDVKQSYLQDGNTSRITAK